VLSKYFFGQRWLSPPPPPEKNWPIRPCLQHTDSHALCYCNDVQVYDVIPAVMVSDVK